MTSHDWFIDHRTAFVTRVLTPDEEKSYLEHLGGCSECREEIARIERDLAWLPLGAGPSAPRPGLNRRLVEGVLGGSRRRHRWIVPFAAAASVVLAVGIWWTGRGREARLREQVAALAGQLADVRDTLSIIRDAGRVLQADISMDGHQGGLMIFADVRTHRWNVVVHGLPPAAPGEVYQFWFICANGMVRSVEVHPSEAVPAFVTLGMPSMGGEVKGAALSVEQQGEQSPEPKGKMLVHLIL